MIDLDKYISDTFNNKLAVYHMPGSPAVLTIASEKGYDYSRLLTIPFELSNPRMVEEITAKLQRYDKLISILKYVEDKVDTFSVKHNIVLSFTDRHSILEPSHVRFYYHGPSKAFALFSELLIDTDCNITVNYFMDNKLVKQYQSIDEFFETILKIRHFYLLKTF